jgi:zona occludens toxin
MLTLVTGTPGAGKTAWTVQELTRLPSQRKIYVHGIPELKIAHEPI